MIMKPVHFVLLAVLSMFLAGCYDEPVANFEFPDLDYTAPAEVTFTNTSTDAESFRWDFGDGETSGEKDPTHTFQQAGTFTVTLNAKGRGGTGTVSKNITISESQTTYLVRNVSQYYWKNVKSFYWDGIDVMDLVEHGTLYPGDDSDEVITERDMIFIGFEFEDGTPAIVDGYYNISPNTLNILLLEDDTEYIYETSTGDEKIPDRELMKLIESGEPGVLKTKR